MAESWKLKGGEARLEHIKVGRDLLGGDVDFLLDVIESLDREIEAARKTIEALVEGLECSHADFFKSSLGKKYLDYENFRANRGEPAPHIEELRENK